MEVAEEFTDYMNNNNLLRISDNTGNSNWMTVIQDIKMTDNIGIKCIRSLSERKIAIGTEEGRVLIYQFNDKNNLKEEEIEQNEEKETSDLKNLNANNIINFVPDDQFIDIILAHKKGINDIIEIKNKNCMATCSDDGKIKFWTKDDKSNKYEPYIFDKDKKYNYPEFNYEDNNNQNENNQFVFENKEEIEEKSVEINKIINLSDNSRFAACFSNREICIYASDDFMKLETIKKHIASVNNILQLENEILVSISDDLSIRFWDIKNIKKDNANLLKKKEIESIELEEINDDDNANQKEASSFSQVGIINGIYNSNKESILDYKLNNKQYLLLNDWIKNEIVVIDANEYVIEKYVSMDNLNINIQSIIKSPDGIVLGISSKGAICKIDVVQQKITNIKWILKRKMITCIAQVGDVVNIFAIGDTFGHVRFIHY